MTPGLSSLRWKIGLALLGVVLLYALTHHVVSRWSVLPSFVALERDGAAKDVRRCALAIHREIHHLSIFTGDWAGWDDTYEFVVDRNEDYITTNLGIETFTANRVNLLCIFDTEGGLVWGKALELESEKSLPAGDLVDIPLPEGYRAADLQIGKGRSGLVMTPRGPMLASFRPILTSQDEGPARGTFVLGRLIGEETWDDLREQTELAFSAVPVSELDETQLQVLSAVKRAGGTHIEEVDDQVLTAHTEMTDIDGNPGLLLSARMPRTISNRGRDALRSALLSTLGGGLFTLLFLMILLRRTVVDPLFSLTNRVVALTGSDDWNARLGVDRNDEIGILAREFDRLLERLAEHMSERERIHAALRKSEEKFRLAMDATKDGLWDWNIETGELYLSPGLLRMLGYDPGIFGMTDHWWDARVHPDDVGEVQRRLEAHIQGREPVYSAEYRARREGDGWRWLLTRGEVVERNAEGRPVRMVGTETDITDLKAMHERVLRSEHLATIGEMSASVAHEVRNPLAGISGAIQVLRESIPERDDRRPVFDEILEQVARVERTVQGLLMFARPWTPEKQWCNVREAIEKLCADIRAREQFSGIRIHLDIPDEIEAWLDRGLCDQVMVNILLNAAQAMPDGGEVRIRAHRTGGTLQVVVADAGPGIAPNVLERVFQPFFTTKTTGTGLGLAVCRQIVVAQGGSINLSSVEGEGTTVTLELPVGEHE